MSQQQAVAEKPTVAEFANQVREQLIPIVSRFSYFAAGVSFNEDDVKEYLEEPVLALPPRLREAIPEVAILLVPYLARRRKRDDGGTVSEDVVCFDRPERDEILDTAVTAPDRIYLAFGVKGQDVAEYHYRLFRRLAELGVSYLEGDLCEPFYNVVREELSSGVHGEVDEESWELKRALQRRQKRYHRRTKGFTQYARQALTDTLSLYLHGICCDIDIETGPRQLPSRHLRRRLELLQAICPPPAGYAVFPEDLKAIEETDLPPDAPVV